MIRKTITVDLEYVLDVFNFVEGALYRVKDPDAHECAAHFVRSAGTCPTAYIADCVPLDEDKQPIEGYECPTPFRAQDLEVLPIDEQDLEYFE